MHARLTRISRPQRLAHARRRRFAPAVVLCLGLLGCGPAPEQLGERIYQAGVGAGGRLAYAQGPGWLQMARGGCAVCHGRDGQGLAMRAGEASGAAPPLTPDYLAARGYDRESLGRAITAGVDPEGRVFGYYMPRWRLDEHEIEALLDYLARL